MGRDEENVGFACARCGRQVEPVADGSYRNHCPFCLWSRHVDVKPGDRANPCRGMMRPVAARVVKKGLQVVHQCSVCGEVRVNRVVRRAVQPDDFEKLLELMRSPQMV